MRFSRLPHSFLRSTNFCTLPVEVLGNSPNSTAAGHLKWAICWRQKAMISASVALWPGFRVAGHVVHGLIDNVYAVGGHIVLALAGEEARLFRNGQRVPLLVPFANGMRAVGLGQTVDVNGTQVKFFHAS